MLPALRLAVVLKRKIWTFSYAWNQTGTVKQIQHNAVTTFVNKHLTFFSPSILCTLQHLLLPSYAMRLLQVLQRETQLQYFRLSNKLPCTHIH